jgi:hypothetical protein
MKLKSLILALLFVFIFSASSFAAINVDNRTGATKIYMPDGKQIVITRDQKMPVIPDGAVVTIVAGCSVVSTTGKSVVKVAIGTYTLQVKEGSKVNLCLNPDGTVTSTIIAGETIVTRKAEAYQSPELPAAPEIVFTGNEERRDISPSQ